jgi:hypothetical protein
MILEHGWSAERLTAAEKREARALNALGIPTDRLEAPYAFKVVALKYGKAVTDEYDDHDEYV